MLPRDERFDFTCPRNLVFGRGKIEELGVYASEVGDTALLVTDPGIREAGLTDPAIDALEAAGVDVRVFAGVEPDPKVSNAQACASEAADVDADVLVGIGGGSSMDVAKTASVLLTNDRPIDELLGRNNVPNRGAPTILVPTTAGTGSEVSPAIVLVDDTGSDEKEGIIDEALMADTALVDPDLTMHLPAPITRATGLDAFAHAIGSYMSTVSNTFADALCVDALELVEANLRDAYFHGADAPEAREKMALAATMAMLGRVNGGKAAVHSIAYGIQAMYDVPHGDAIAMVLPETVEYNLPAATDDFARLGERLYSADGGRRERAETLVRGVYRLRDDLGADRTLRSVGATDGDMDELAELASHSARHLEPNARPMDRDDVATVLRQIW